VLRHRWSIAAYSWLHPDFASRLAMASSQTSRKGRALDGGAGLLAVGTRQLETPGGPDLVLHGHSHVPMLVPAGRGTYGNAGAWYLDRQYLLIEERQVSRRQWCDTGADVVLDVATMPNEHAASAHDPVIRRV
ncbi:MAG: hypothetical protein ACK54K_03050, partial [Gemmatimonadaceae bacterium]